MIRIRKITPADLAALRQISRNTFFHTFRDSTTPENMERYLDKAYCAEKLTRELNDPDMAFYFAQIDDEPVGYLKLNFARAQTELREESAVEIERIYVLPAFHGKGVGQALYEFAVQIARQRQAEYIWLGVWEHNYKAMAFYRKNGFVAFDRHIFAVGDDEQTDIMMKSTLK